MDNKYQAAFIIPNGSNKILGDDGWEFKASCRLSDGIKDILIEQLKLGFLESYLGIDAYIGGDIKMSIVYDEKNKIEHIFFQLHGDGLLLLSKLYQAYKIADEAELFIPESTR